MVQQGLITGSQSKSLMSDVTAEYVDKFWELIDEVLNATICFNRPRATSNTYIPKNTFLQLLSY
jgi:hypothetical protein